ncbi:unnamed protein product [Heterosigma akashiwo]
MGRRIMLQATVCMLVFILCALELFWITDGLVLKPQKTPVGASFSLCTKKSRGGDQKSVTTQATKCPRNRKMAMSFIDISLTKPMGITFEENDPSYGGIYIESIDPTGAAAADGTLRPGDQLVAVGGEDVAGKSFEEAMDELLFAPADGVGLRIFRGSAAQLWANLDVRVTFDPSSGPATTVAARPYQSLEEVAKAAGVPISFSCKRATATSARFLLRVRRSKPAKLLFHRALENSK